MLMSLIILTNMVRCSWSPSKEHHELLGAQPTYYHQTKLRSIADYIYDNFLAPTISYYILIIIEVHDSLLRAHVNKKKSINELLAKRRLRFSTLIPILKINPIIRCWDVTKLVYYLKKNWYLW